MASCRTSASGRALLLVLGHVVMVNVALVKANALGRGAISNSNALDGFFNPYNIYGNGNTGYNAAPNRLNGVTNSNSLDNALNANEYPAPAGANAPSIANANAIGGDIRNGNNGPSIANANAIGGALRNGNGGPSIANANAIGGALRNGNGGPSIANANAIGGALGNGNGGPSIANANAIGFGAIANANAARSLTNSNSVAPASVSNKNKGTNTGKTDSHSGENVLPYHKTYGTAFFNTLASQFDKDDVACLDNAIKTIANANLIRAIGNANAAGNPTIADFISRDVLSGASLGYSIANANDAVQQATGIPEDFWGYANELALKYGGAGGAGGGAGAGAGANAR
uniref:Spermatophylax protein 11 n=1 Tax=Gryllodes sigillatus TaxID=13551 RepID=A0A0P0AL16_9ORTH|nr:spermatophylax protein 11 [Gryllodes sigillatus]